MQPKNRFYEPEVEEEEMGAAENVVPNFPKPSSTPSGKKMYISDEVLEILNNQIYVEFNASQLYKAAGSWCEYIGYVGAAKWLLKHVNEERAHMNKIYEYILDRQAVPCTPAVEEQPKEFKDLKDVLEQVLAHEEYVEETYRAVISAVFQEGDLTTFSFLQFFLNEQVEEIKVVAGLLDRLKIIGEDQKGMYFLDKEIGKL